MTGRTPTAEPDAVQAQHGHEPRPELAASTPTAELDAVQAHHGREPHPERERSRTR